MGLAAVNHRLDKAQCQQSPPREKPYFSRSLFAVEGIHGRKFFSHLNFMSGE